MKKTFPLTHAQRGVFTECMRYPESQHYGLPSIVRVGKDIDVDRLEACINKVINTFSNYNMKLVWVDNDIRQTLRENRDFHLTRITCSSKDVDKYVKQILQPFDLFNEQLVRVLMLETEDEVVMLHNFHHLTVDGVTLSMLYTKALSALYNDGVEPVEKFSLFDYALEQEAYDKSPDHEKSVEYYKKRFGGKVFRPLPTHNPSSPIGKALLECVDIPRGEVDDFVKQMGIRPNFLLEAVYNITLSAFTRSDSVSYITLQHGRYSRPARMAHGMFISSIPVGIDINPDMPVIDFVRQFKAEMFHTVRNANFSLMDFLRINGSLPDTMYAYQGPKMLEKIDLDGREYRIAQIRIADNTTASFSVVVYETPDAYQLRLECSDAYLNSAELRRFGYCMKACVENVIAAPETPVRRVAVVSQQQQQELMDMATTKLIAVPQPTILNMLRDGDACAVVAHDGTLTYTELYRQAKNVASHLLQHGVKSGDFVAVQTDRTREFVVAVMGIMMAGAAYVPIDMAYPKERIDFMMEDSRAVMTLSADVVELWKDERLPDVVLPEVTGDMKAYMIYTSGSTGTPKGVVISHAALASFVASITQVLGISADDRIACHSSFSFDASVEDLFPVLLAGGTLFIVPENLRRDIPGLAKWLNDNNITGGNYTTRFGQLLLAAEDLPNLRYLVVGGEKMTAWPARNRHIRVFNTYGPTECTVDATYYELTADTNVKDIPIGKALPGVCAFVCDHHGRLLPLGAEGELWLSGTQLAEGYWMRDDITAHNFVVDDGAHRYYRTGDIVMWGDDGLMVYLRRDDGQVKLNGYRVELADIEAQILNYPDVLEVKVLVIKQMTESLCAYYTADADVDEVSLKAFLTKRLPAYMVPSVFVRMEKMPVNVVGKLDVSKLPLPEMMTAGTGDDAMDEDAMPLSHGEQLLLDVVKRVTGYQNIRVTDSLMRYGLSSMQLIQVAVEADKVGCHVKMERITEVSSIRDIISHDDSADGNDVFCWINRGMTEDVDVVFCGTTSLQQMTDYAKGLKHSVLLFMPIADDQDASFDGMITDYVDVIAGQLENNKLNAFIGHSFGGEIAYRVAMEWSHRFNVSPDIVLIDTTLKLPDAKDFLPMDVVKQYFDAMPKEQGIFWSEYYRRAVLASRLHDENKLKGYDGALVLYNALQRDRMFLDLIPLVKEHVDEDSLAQWKEIMHEQALANAKNWKETHPKINVIDVDADHYGVLTSIYY